MLYIGIDPGKETGVAGWDSVLKWLKFTENCSFWRCIEILQYHKDHEKDLPFKVIMEDPNLNKPIFAKRGAEGRAYLRIAQNVGMNKGDALRIYEFCIKENIEIETVRPATSKWTKAYFCGVTKWKKTSRVSQHEIDAAKLVIGL